MSAPGGYRVCAEDLERIGVKYLCSSCGFVLRMAMQVEECGHMYCEECMDEVKRQNHPACVKCGISLELQTQVFADKFVRREIENFKVNCTNVAAGCEWSGNLRFLEEHQCECPLRPLCCGNNGCSQEVPACHKELHEQQECSYHQVMCPHCNSAETVGHLEAHLEICPAFPVSCPNCGMDNIPRSQLRRHNDPVNGDCTRNICPFTSVGCTCVEHQCECPLRPLCCGNNGCSQEVPACHKELHEQQECSYHQVMCPHCNSAETVGHLEAHLEICPAFPVSCPNCGMDNIPRSQLRRHNDPVNGDCTRNICPFTSVGCTCVELMSREDLMKHVEENLNSHLLLLLSVFKNSSQKDTPAGIRQELQSAEAEIVSEHTWALSNQNRRLGELDDEVKRLEDTLMAATARSTQEISALQRQLARQDDKINYLSQLMGVRWG